MRPGGYPSAWAIQPTRSSSIWRDSRWPTGYQRIRGRPGGGVHEREQLRVRHDLVVRACLEEERRLGPPDPVGGDAVAAAPDQVDGLRTWIVAGEDRRDLSAEREADDADARRIDVATRG